MRELGQVRHTNILSLPPHTHTSSRFASDVAAMAASCVVWGGEDTACCREDMVCYAALRISNATAVMLVYPSSTHFYRRRTAPHLHLFSLSPPSIDELPITCISSSPSHRRTDTHLHIVASAASCAVASATLSFTERAYDVVLLPPPPAHTSATAASRAVVARLLSASIARSRFAEDRACATASAESSSRADLSCAAATAARSSAAACTRSAASASSRAAVARPCAAERAACSSIVERARSSATAAAIAERSGCVLLQGGETLLLEI